LYSLHIARQPHGQERKRVVRRRGPVETKKQVAQNTEIEVAQEEGAGKVALESKKVEEETV
jgi:hypothetical protein